MGVSAMAGILGSWVLSLYVGGVELQAPLWLEEQGHRPCCHCCPIPCGCGCLCSQEASALLSLMLPGCLGLRAQPLRLTVQDCRRYFQCSPGSASFMCPTPPTFRCTDVWNSLMSWCVGQKHLCLAVDVLLIVDWRGEIKRASHTTTMLMSHQKDCSCTGGR